MPDNPYPYLFKWTSKDQLEARYSRNFGVTEENEIAFLGLLPQEIICRFKKETGMLDNIYVSIYNTGDARKVSKKTFYSMIALADSKVKEIAGTRGELESTDFQGYTISRKVWIDSRKYLAYVLMWSYQEDKKQFDPDYIQLDILRYDPNNDPRKRPLDGLMSKQKPCKNDLKDNVVTLSNGTIYIDNIPMVDQGAKGYCVAAVSERILRYFGINDMNQHRIASFYGTDAVKGTDVTKMQETFEKIGKDYGIRIVGEYTRFATLKDLEDVLSSYNKIARKLDKKEGSMRGYNRTVDLNATLLGLNPDILKEVICKKKLEQRAFFKDVADSISEGIPVAWCVCLGLVPEKELPASMQGGHMRLIIGINENKRLIVYSDTWGAEHEIKTMSYDDAFLITTSASRFEPRKK